MNKILKSAGVAACGLVALFSASAAQALERGQCLPTAQMITALKAEGQDDVINATKITSRGVDAQLYYTTNKDQTRGYEMGGSITAVGQTPATLCISRVLSNIKLVNAWAERRVPSNFFAANSLTAEQEAAEQARGVNDGDAWDLNRGLKSWSDRGIYPTFQASVIENGTVSQYTVTVAAKIADRSGATAITRNDGLTVTEDTLLSFTYSDQGIKQIASNANNAQPQLAALSPARR